MLATDGARMNTDGNREESAPESIPLSRMMCGARRFRGEAQGAIWVPRRMNTPQRHRGTEKSMRTGFPDAVAMGLEDHRPGGRVLTLLLHLCASVPHLWLILFLCFCARVSAQPAPADNG